MSAATIWDHSFFEAGKAFLSWSILAILLFVFMAKGTKPYEWNHLFCGMVLIGLGIADLGIALMNKTLMVTLFENHALSSNAKQDGEQMWSAVQLSLPALALAFGTRFVGNWVTAERP